MIEFNLENRRLRLIDGVFYARALNNKGEETKKEIWSKMSFCDVHGYLRCSLALNKVPHGFLQHRLVWYAHHQEWDIFDSSIDNQIDHKNQNKKDNRLCNLHVVTNAENLQNKDCNGCSFNKLTKKWVSRIMINCKNKYIGQYDTYEEAHEAYLKAKRILHSHFVENEEL